MWRRETANNARGLEVGLLSLTESYRPREIRFLDLWELPGWRAKVYGIAHHSQPAFSRRRLRRWNKVSGP